MFKLIFSVYLHNKAGTKTKVTASKSFMGVEPEELIAMLEAWYQEHTAYPASELDMEIKSIKFDTVLDKMVITYTYTHVNEDNSFYEFQEGKPYIYAMIADPDDDGNHPLKFKVKAYYLVSGEAD
jgi:hypothetical protein